MSKTNFIRNKPTVYLFNGFHTVVLVLQLYYMLFITVEAQQPYV
jgi:hypothetical protein